ncbi:MAG: amidophosphoribosyltransferase [SAR324 cluster bacterium]|uniref:Amidophosphoribosyltransferase n=1 Tax=SAR324 cluster bacterium TaxID=2024889 RepID=A0A2A4T1Z6_9DELT|nr:MAG: amidophosphoribosyltransferase [SAR324 cluster bacterium]
MCGVFGIIGHPRAKHFFPTILQSLQHRGHDSAGVAGFLAEDLRMIETVKGVGKISNVINEASLERFQGTTFIGHTRYATRNESGSLREVHPHWAQSMRGRLVIVTNGDLVNVQELKEIIKKEGIKTYTENDAELIAALINIQIRLYDKTIVQAIQYVMEKAKGGYAAMVLREDDEKLYAFRDPWGIRPLHLGEFVIDGQKCVGVGSETCSFDIIQRFNLAYYPDKSLSYVHREVRPGEILSIDSQSNITSSQYAEAQQGQIGCVFESIYFARPDSMQRGESYQRIRERMGKQLNQESPVEADLVTAVPKGGIPSAVGYAKASGLPYEIAILEEPSTGGIRSFTTNERDRHALATMKYNILQDVVKGKRLVVVDDSIVRGTTSRLLIKNLFLAGAKEVHLRIPCPPYNNPCYYGIATKDPKTLISHNRTVSEICEELGATSLAYLSIPGLYQAIKQDRKYFCDECLSGRKPIDF